MRVLVTGPRDLDQLQPIHDSLIAATRGVAGPHTLVHGACPDGADQLFAQAATALGWAVEAHPADWDSCGPHCPTRPHRYRRKAVDKYHPGVLPDYCPKAGPRRNADMVALGADECIAILVPCAQPGCRRRGAHFTHGTASCVRLAKEAGIPIRPVHLSTPDANRPRQDQT